ncbi:hypothetical protein KKC94_04730 [Patescibacteria group bacterium]|nr:hypothetical protein [Patescibacteria group bacterium]
MEKGTVLGFDQTKRRYPLPEGGGDGVLVDFSRYVFEEGVKGVLKRENGEWVFFVGEGGPRLRVAKDAGGLSPDFLQLIEGQQCGAWISRDTEEGDYVAFQVWASL